MFPAICLVLIRRGAYTRSFMIQIWMGKTLVNGSGFTKFAKVFPHHRFALYGICVVSQFTCTFVAQIMWSCASNIGKKLDKLYADLPNSP